MTLHEALDVGEALVGDAETARPRGAQEPDAEAAAEQEAHEVAEGGGDPDDQQEERELDLAARRHDAAEDDRGLARRDEPDERAGLHERQARDERVRPVPEGVRGSVMAPCRSGSWTAPAVTAANAATAASTASTSAAERRLMRAPAPATSG